MYGRRLSIPVLLLAAVAAFSPTWAQPPGTAKEATVQIAFDWQAQPVLVLSSPGQPALPLYTGEREVYDIARLLAGEPSVRPMTEDLLFETLTTTGWRVHEARLTKFEKDTYYAEITLTNGAQSKTLDSRASDAVNLALRAKVPFLVEEAVFQAGAEHDEQGKPLDAAGVYRKLQQPEDLATKYLERAVREGAASLEVLPQQVWVQAPKADVKETRVYDMPKGPAVLHMARRFLELAGLSADNVPPARTGTFIHEQDGHRYKVTVSASSDLSRPLHVQIEPAP